MPIQPKRTRKPKDVEDDQQSLVGEPEEVIEEEVVAEGEEEVGFDVNEPVEVMDLDEAEDANAAIESAKDVTFIVKKASVKAIDSGGGTSALKPIMRKVLAIQLAVGPDGVDGEGLYANKVFFPESALGGFLLWYDASLTQAHHEKMIQVGQKKPKPFNADWWKKNAPYATKEFFLAVGAIEKDPDTGKLSKVVVDDEFLKDLIDTEIVADILKVKDAYRGEGAFKNEVKNFRAAEVGEE